MKKNRYFPPRRQLHPEMYDQKSVRSRWREDYLDESGRILDIGPGNGLTALDIYWVYRKRELLRKLTSIPVVLFFLVLLSLVVLIALTGQYRLIGSIISAATQREATISSAATILLTLGLLIVTWRYTKLTALIVEEMKEARKFESEPQISIYVWPWLKKPEDPEIAYELTTRIVIRNVGKSLALDAALNTDSYGINETGQLYSSGSAYSMGSQGTTATLAPGDNIEVLLGYSKKDIAERSHQQLANWPFVTLRFRFRDAYNQVYTITQDYGLTKTEDLSSCALHLQCEFISAPSGYRWRAKFDQGGIWITA